MTATPVTEIRPAPEAQPEVGGPLPRSRLPKMLPWLLLVVAVLAAGAFAQLWQRAESAQDRELELRHRARGFVLALTNFSSGSIESDVDEIRSYATGRFAEEVDTLFSDQTIDAIERAKASSSSDVEDLLVQSMGAERASVFAVVSEEVTNEALQEPQLGVIRLEVDLLKTDAGWKVEGVQLFQSPGEDFLPS